MLDEPCYFSTPPGITIGPALTSTRVSQPSSLSTRATHKDTLAARAIDTRWHGRWHATIEADPQDDPADQQDFLEKYAGL